MSLLRRCAPPTLLAALAALACAPCARAAESRAFVFGTDYTTGSLSTSDLSPRASHCDVASPSADAVLRYYQGLLYVVNRAGASNVQVIDPATNGTLRQFSVGAGSNPHDIAFASPTKAYVTRYASSDLWIVDPSTGAHTGTISLAAFADADGIPEMDRMIVVGPLLFVSIERLDENALFAPTGVSYVAVVDTRADTLVDCDPATPGVQAIRLALENPATTFQFDSATSRLLIGCVGAYGALDGGVEWIDPVHLRSGGVAVTESVLGGDVSALAWTGAQKSYVIVSDSGGNTLLESWSAATGAKLATLWNPGGFSLADLAVNDRGELWVADGAMSSPRVRVFSTSSDAPVGSDIVCTLPPAALTFDAASAQVSGVPEAATALAFSAASPSPARARTSFTLELSAPALVRLAAYDAAGRRVRTLASGPRPAGRMGLSWDLADDAGRRVAPGLYLVRAQAGAAAWTRRVVVLPR